MARAATDSPRPLGVLLHYFVLLCLVALFLALAVPRLTTEVQAALQLKEPLARLERFEDRLLNAIATRLHHLPAASRLVHPALTAGETAMKILVGILFTFAAAAYWLFERDRAIDRSRASCRAPPQVGFATPGS